MGERLPGPVNGPHGDEKDGVKIPEDREQDGRKDAAVEGGTRTARAEASPMTASEGPAVTTAGTSGGLTRDGGEPRAGGTRLSDGKAASRAPGVSVAGMRTSKVAMFDHVAAQEKLLAEG